MEACQSSNLEDNLGNIFGNYNTTDISSSFKFEKSYYANHDLKSGENVVLSNSSESNTRIFDERLQYLGRQFSKSFPGKKEVINNFRNNIARWYKGEFSLDEVKYANNLLGLNGNCDLIKEKRFEVLEFVEKVLLISGLYKSQFNPGGFLENTRVMVEYRLDPEGYKNKVMNRLIENIDICLKNTD